MVKNSVLRLPNIGGIIQKSVVSGQRPQGLTHRHARLWDLIEEIRNEGNYDSFDDALYGRSGIIVRSSWQLDSGKIITIDTPHNLIKQCVARFKRKEQDCQANQQRTCLLI